MLSEHGGLRSYRLTGAYCIDNNPIRCDAQRDRICASSVIHSGINRPECKRSDQQILRRERRTPSPLLGSLMIHVSCARARYGGSLLRDLIFGEGGGGCNPVLLLLHPWTNYLVSSGNDLPANEKQQILCKCYAKRPFGHPRPSCRIRLRHPSQASRRGKKSFRLKYRYRVSISSIHSRRSRR